MTTNQTKPATNRKARKMVKAWIHAAWIPGRKLMVATSYTTRSLAIECRAQDMAYGYLCGPIVAIAVPGPVAGRGVGK